MIINRYFDREEFEKAISFFNTDPYRTVKLFEIYLEKYPCDYSAYPYYCGALIKIGRLDDAKKISDYVEKKANSDTNYINLGIDNFFRANMAYTKIKILCYQKKYMECKYVCKEEFQRLMENNINVVSVINYCDIKLKNSKLKKDDSYGYVTNQMIKYSYKSFLEHLQKHTYNEENYDDNPCVFSIDFPVDDILKEVRKYIPSDKRILNGILDNEYYFKYDNSGIVNGKRTNFFKVVTFHDTTDFITMYPSHYGEKYPYIDLNYVRINDIPAQKKLSQIDKFNRRYNRS